MYIFYLIVAGNGVHAAFHDPGSIDLDRGSGSKEGRRGSRPGRDPVPWLQSARVGGDQSGWGFAVAWLDCGGRPAVGGVVGLQWSPDRSGEDGKWRRAVLE